MEMLEVIMIIIIALITGISLGILWEKHKENKLIQEIMMREVHARMVELNRQSFRVLKGGKE